MRLWCADNGWTDFGPYGGVPSEEESPGRSPQVPRRPQVPRNPQVPSQGGGDYDDLDDREE